ncbi:MAG: GTPase [Candidatus Aenigmarchaeota archaeon]|nr:GTPase [Candidatus Aenigmarchaeota archaeon]NIP39955.1 GTPase [Candidatus Aenigmarchaeota archaeon]NIQ17674.1 GTPase [Candidatus Aenigmarchaeota archaeon]NIS72862.1 GTPase [Candidatus Aenigmarchaeota archaeon]
MKRKVIIMGAAGRDFHNFNVFFRNNKNYEVVCFTAEQIPNISGRCYPKELSGKLYPKGVPIYEEKDLPVIIKKHKADMVVLAYSDLSYENVMHKASLVNANGADFVLMGSETTMIKSRKPVVSVCAVRTGCGKSQTSRRISLILKEMGYKVVVIRHPMPYGDLRKQIAQRFADYGDLYRHECTIEEREEYEQHIKNGFVVYAGVDYGEILKEAEKEADIILWDGGNNDFPFFKPYLHIVVADPHRPGHGIRYYPGETNLRMADVVVINKENTAKNEDIRRVWKVIRKTNPSAKIIHANSEVTTDEPEKIRNRKVLIVEDGPTLTHGEMSYGAGWVAAKKFHAKRIVRPKEHAVGSIKRAYEKYAQIKEVLPALGYGKTQIKELERTINRTPCDLVIIATPMDLAELIRINKPSVYITYHLKEKGRPDLREILKEFFKKKGTRKV